MDTMITETHIHIGDIVALPTGFIAKVVQIGSTQIGLQYPGRPITFFEEVSKLRYLGKEYQPLTTSKSLDDLIRMRNDKGMQLLLGKAVGRKIKESSKSVKKAKKSEAAEKKQFLSALISATSSEEVQALLRTRGLLPIATDVPNSNGSHELPNQKEEAKR